MTHPSSQRNSMVEVSPPQLIFHVIPNKISKLDLHLRNTSDTTPLAYKVKTTAPKRYCVRPTFGIIHPGATEDVQVLLNALKEKPSEEERDKFQVLALPITKEQAATGDELKSVWAQAKEDEIIKHRLKCYFKFPSSDKLQSPVFTPTIPPEQSASGYSDSSTLESPTQPEHSTVTTVPTQPEKIVNNSTFEEPKSSVPSDDAAVSREQLQRVNSRLTVITHERDQLQKELQKLREETKKEESLRQRKSVSFQTPPTTPTSSSSKDFEKELHQQELQRIQAQQIVQLVIVALVFFLLGWIL